jgi:CRP/FNR family transcriptional regulator, cyclic AMP receptor protein
MQIMHLMPNGKSIVELCGSGWIIGIASAMTGNPYTYSAMTLEDCEVEEVEAGEFLQHLKKDVFVTYDVLRYVSRRRIKLLNHFYEAVAKVPSEERLLRVLAEISQTCGVRVEEGVRINLPLPIQILADWIGCSRQWASKLLSHLVACGALKRHNGWITLPDAKPDPNLCRRFPKDP